MPGEDVEATVSHVGALIGLGAEVAPIEEPAQLFFSARRFVEQVARDRPTVFVFEDIHWAEPVQLDLLEYLAAQVRDRPAIFLALARSELLEVRPTWGSGVLGHTTIPLEPLSAPDAASIASFLLADVDTTAVARLVEVAEGNPLFIEELAASLVDRGPSDELPTTVRAAIASRIDALPPASRAALLAASVIGKHFWRGVLRAIDDLDDMDDALAALEARDLIRRESLSQVKDDAEFSFKHILIREVAYATLPRADRRRRHAAAATYIEEALHDRARNLAWILAHHWREAGADQRAIPYLIAAAEQADEQLAFHHSLTLYSSALELLPEDDARRRDLTVRRAIALTRLSHAVYDQGRVRWQRDVEA